MTATQVPADGTALYRVRGENALLLYVGVSDNFGRRWKEHAKQQPWWKEMRSLSVDRWYPTRGEAEAAEAAAIKAERPKYNKTHNAPAKERRTRVSVDPYPILARAARRQEEPRWEISPDSIRGMRRVGGPGGTEWPKRLTGGGGGSCWRPPPTWRPSRRHARRVGGGVVTPGARGRESARLDCPALDMYSNERKGWTTEGQGP